MGASCGACSPDRAVRWGTDRIAGSAAHGPSPADLDSSPAMMLDSWAEVLSCSAPEVVAWLASGHLVMRGPAFGAR